MINPIIKEFKKLKLINFKNCSLISPKTRDKKINVFIDKKTGVIFLEKFLLDKNHYQNDRKMNFKSIQNYINSLSHDDNRRFKQFKKLLAQKKILDFGCEFGGFLKIINNSKKLYGLEINKNCINYIKKKIKKIKIFKNLKNNQTKFDIITMFHVLEHIPSQVGTLELLRSNLNKKGKIVIEVPSANDFLISLDDLKNFKEFTFWSEHLVLHTKNSLKKILKASGYKNIKIINFQRYNINNHLGWFLKKKPGGHIFFKDIFDQKINKYYVDFLVKKNKTDTLIAIAENK